MMLKIDDYERVSKEAAIEMLTNFSKKGIPIIKGIYEMMMNRYKELGEPCGKGHDGLMAWLKELNAQES